MHSRWNGYEERSLLGCGVYPLRRTSGFTPAGPSARMDEVVADAGEEDEQQDIVDEALYLFKPHLLFRTFPIKGAGDRVILYVTMYLHECLKKIANAKREEASAALLNYATVSFAIPGDVGFRFNGFFLVGDHAEREEWEAYARQLRVEAGFRLVEKVFMFPEKDGTGNKFWMAFAKRPFLPSE
ncbi:ARP2/3 complex subunit [Trypanosoma grayi]|uniref:ARP2/3 complex subunit n=1 Tax=Trypanosoma grayi TaxID=71804 RepID=UPI0004F40056|nr:ARP2/3 complex subunit [Trypanosoma grayi]KEG13440.1 ARP2/3 complex subunit [Trypanosoma grayi]